MNANNMVFDNQGNRFVISQDSVCRYGPKAVRSVRLTGASIAVSPRGSISAHSGDVILRSTRNGSVTVTKNGVRYCGSDGRDYHWTGMKLMGPDGHIWSDVCDESLADLLVLTDVFDD